MLLKIDEINSNFSNNHENFSNLFNSYVSYKLNEYFYCNFMMHFMDI